MAHETDRVRESVKLFLNYLYPPGQITRDGGDLPHMSQQHYLNREPHPDNYTDCEHTRTARWRQDNIKLHRQGTLNVFSQPGIDTVVNNGGSDWNSRVMTAPASGCKIRAAHGAHGVVTSMEGRDRLGKKSLVLEIFLFRLLIFIRENTEL